MQSLTSQLKDAQKKSWREYSDRTYLHVHEDKFKKGFEKGLKNKKAHMPSFNTSRAYQAGYKAGKFNHELAKSLDNPHDLAIDL